MVQTIKLFVEVMASANTCSSSSGKRKSACDSVCSEVEVEATEAIDSVGNVAEIPSDLAPIVVRSTCRSEREMKSEEEEEESCATPKCEARKIPPMTVCPPPPRKPKSCAVKRNPAIIPCRRAHYFPSDSPDLDILFGSNLRKDRQHRRKKLKMRETSSNIGLDSQS